MFSSCYWLGRAVSLRRFHEETQREIDQAYRAGLERGRQERGQRAFEGGYRFALQLCRQAVTRKQFPVGVTIVRVTPKQKEGVEA
jgi:hypothetical protein